MKTSTKTNRCVFKCIVIAIVLVTAQTCETASAAAGPLGYRWMKLELEEFTRLITWLRRDETKLRRELKALKTQRKNVSVFFNGFSSAQSRKALRVSLRRLEQTPVVKTLLLTSVPPFEAGQFLPHGVVFKVVQRDGSLISAPPELQPDTAGTALATAKTEFEELWSETVQHIRDGRTLSMRHLTELQSGLDRWRRAAKPNIFRSSRFGRFRAGKYFKQVAGVIRNIEDPRNAQRLSATLGERPAFAGGTLADLLHHVLANNLSIRYGSGAQVALSELGHDMARELDTMISLTEYRVERFKAQNPSHNAALKARLAGGYYWLGWPAGLGSRAYGDPLPQRFDVDSRPLPASLVERFKDLLGLPVPVLAKDDEL